MADAREKVIGEEDKPEILVERIIHNPFDGWFFQLRFLWHGQEWGLSRKLPDDVTVGWNAESMWIPVTERLPEDVYGKDREQIVVLVCTKSGKVSQCTRCADYDCSTDATFSQVKWHKNGKFYWSKDKKVTHWMPLPEPPKGE